MSKYLFIYFYFHLFVDLFVYSFTHFFVYCKIKFFFIFKFYLISLNFIEPPPKFFISVNKAKTENSHFAEHNFVDDSEVWIENNKKNSFTVNIEKNSQKNSIKFPDGKNRVRVLPSSCPDDSSSKRVRSSD